MHGRYKAEPPWQCFECGLQRMVKQIERAHTPGTPEYEQVTSAGREVGRQIAERTGPWFEKWKAGVLRTAGVTDGERGGTHPVTS